MRRFAPPLALVLLAAAACTGTTDPASSADTASPENAAPPENMEQLDRLWTDVVEAQTRLRLIETELTIECLAAEGFTSHNVRSMTNSWSYKSPAPSVILAGLDDPIGFPDAAEAETRALGHWLSFAEAYGDQAGIDLNTAEQEAAQQEAETDESETAVVDLSSFESAGEGWDDLSAREQMVWEIAYRGADWATISKAASVLTADDWEAVGLPGGEWVEADAMTGSPEGCQGEVLTELHGEPRQVDNGSDAAQWVWGPILELDAGGFAPIAVGVVPEAESFETCLADSGHAEWTLSASGGLDFDDHWREQYLPEAAQDVVDGVTEYRYSDITEADRENYETVKAAEFEAAAAIAACDESSGYSAAASLQYEETIAASFLEHAPAQQAYLAELEAALAAIDA
ncbi:hypothetical protein [Glycomyces sp. NRRL B-16210]|uniref:hypothetical protein n=1 Tax=Glycomyces sp. NRRL B-16210 TaxID=1463821 RepID=UPI0004C08640|nr:hypothetical protein [Glycomyces sp. NRRL B-16210]